MLNVMEKNKHKLIVNSQLCEKRKRSLNLQKQFEKIEQYLKINKKKS